MRLEYCIETDTKNNKLKNDAIWIIHQWIIRFELLEW